MLFSVLFFAFSIKNPTATASCNEEAVGVKAIYGISNNDNFKYEWNGTRLMLLLRGLESMNVQCSFGFLRGAPKKRYDDV